MAAGLRRPSRSDEELGPEVRPRRLAAGAALRGGVRVLLRRAAAADRRGQLLADERLRVDPGLHGTELPLDLRGLREPRRALRDAEDLLVDAALLAADLGLRARARL